MEYKSHKIGLYFQDVTYYVDRWVSDGLGKYCILENNYKSHEIDVFFKIIYI